MTDTILATGSFEFRDGSFSTEYLAYVLGRPGDDPALDLRDGTAKIYDLSPALLLAFGATSLSGGSAFFITTEPNGAFEDFAIYPDTASDPTTGFVLTQQAGNTAGVGSAWSRHYRVMVPPKQARYVVPHIRLGSLAANTSQYLDAHQVEVLRTDQNAPTAFGSARAIKVTVRPKRLNYATGSTSVTSLIPGRVYTASADVNGARESYRFTPTQSAWTLVFSGTATRILVEEGTTEGDYFDGNSGPDYLWEQGGTPGQTRSYYYPDREMRHYILVRTLEENVALGMTVEDPVYAVLPAPSSTS